MEIIQKLDLELDPDLLLLSIRFRINDLYKKIKKFPIAKINKLFDQAMDSMCDDFNTPQFVARLFDLSAIINSLYHGKLDMTSLSEDSIENLKTKYREYVVDILGLKSQEDESSSKLNDVMELVIDIRKDARKQKNFEISDKIRDRLSEVKIQLKDDKDDKTSWTIIR